MGLKLTTNIDTVNKRITGVLQNWFLKKAENLAEAGKQLVQIAVTSGNYQDQTGNLRNSIGFLVAMDGKILFEQFNEGVGGQEARLKAQEKISNDGLMLVVVVGMEYGVYVESKGFDVITSAEQIAKSLIPRILK